MNPVAAAMPADLNQDRFVDSHAPAGERTYAMFTHLAIAGFLIVGIPVVGSLVMWLVKRNESPFLEDHGRESVNFQISLVLYALILIPISLITCGIGALGYIGLYVLGAVGAVMAAMAANRGEYFRYPMTIRMLS